MDAPRRPSLPDRGAFLRLFEEDTRGAAAVVRRVLSPRGRQLLRAGGFGVPAG